MNWTMRPRPTLSPRAKSVVIKIATISTILLLSAGPVCAQTGTLAPPPFQTVLDNNGEIVNNACVWTYAAGTSTPVTTWTTKALSAANTNPIRSDPAGRFTAYLVPGLSYKFVYEQPCTPPAHGSVLKTADYIDGVPGSTATVDVTATAGEALSVGQVAYLSDGSGSKVAGQWYKADAAFAYSSTTPTVGVVLAAIAASATGTMRLTGLVPGLTSLSVGGVYYVGTAGAMTTTAPAVSVRRIGQADSTTSLIVSGNPPPVATGPIVACGRLTLTTALPVTTADVTAATTLYYTPVSGCNQITLWTASGLVTDTLTQTSIAVPATTSTLYDVFALDTAGVVSLELVAWTNDTTRAATPTLQHGFLAKSTDATRRYLGNMRTTGVSGQTEDSAAKRFVWNYYHRVPRLLRVTEATDSWTYSTLTWHQVNASTANQVAFIVGWAEGLVDLTATALAGNSAGSADVFVGIGLDSTSALATGCLPGWGIGGAAAVTNALISRLHTVPAIGYHYAAWLEASAAVPTTTWYGDHGNAAFYQTGLTGWYQG